MLLTKRLPYLEYTTVAQLKQAVCINKIRPEIRDTCQSFVDLISECWSFNLAFRPPFKAIIKRLEVVAVDVAIAVERDPRANAFWKRNFRDRITVDWPDFMNALSQELQLIQNRTPIMKLFESNSPILEGTVIPKNIVCLRAILVEQSNTERPTDVVKLETFGKVISWFGPLVPSTNDKDGLFLDRIRTIVCSPWFHGSITQQESEQALRNKNYGTFLVRFSTSSFGAYAISKVTTKNNCKVIFHHRFTYDLVSDTFVIKKENQEQKHYPTITTLLEQEKLELGLEQPCLGSPFTSIVMPEKSKGYVTSSNNK